MTHNPQQPELYAPAAGDRIAFTSTAPIWLRYERATVGGAWPDLQEGWATLDRTSRCGECGHPKPMTARFRFADIEPAHSPYLDAS